MALSVWDVVRDYRTPAMRLADEEVDAQLPDEPDPVERMRQEIIALVDLWTAARAALTNAPEESCPACTAGWRRLTRKANPPVVTPQAPTPPVVMPPAAESLAPPVAAVQPPSESDRLHHAVATISARVERLTHDERRGRLSAA